jgi:hypothetical protein
VRRHATDLSSLIAGLMFVAIGVSYLVAVATDVRIEWRWVLPLGLIGLGLAGLAGTINQARHQRTSAETVESSSAEEPEPAPERGPERGPDEDA